MKKIASKLTDLIGNTPLLRLNNISDRSESEILAKLENLNPGGSIKDRTALSLIEHAEKNGLITKDTVIIEPTSGNTGIGLAWIASSKGYKTIIVMPEGLSIERQKIIKAFGGQIEFTDPSLGMQGAIDKANEIASELENTYIPQQFENEANCTIHEEETAKEIWEDTGGDIDIFITGIGTGGTITGVGRALKKLNNNVKIIGVEPENCSVVKQKIPQKEDNKSDRPDAAQEHIIQGHSIQGIGAGFIPEILNAEIIDDVITISDEDSMEYTQKLAREEGVLCGISSGALYKAAETVCEKYPGKTIVIIIADTGERYLSTPLYS